MVALEFLQHLEAVEPAALQPDVQNHQTGAARTDSGQSLVGIGGLTGVYPLVVEDTRNQHPYVGFVIDD
jgi:hypothetical protein